MTGYSSAQAEISVTLSQLAYCGRNSYMNQVWTGPVSDFVPTKVIYNGVLDDTEGFVGYLPSDQSIFVVFRGSESLANWLTNLSTAKRPWTSFPECGKCQVHSGFYGSE